MTTPEVSTGVNSRSSPPTTPTKPRQLSYSHRLRVLLEVHPRRRPPPTIDPQLMKVHVVRRVLEVIRFSVSHVIYAVDADGRVRAWTVLLIRLQLCVALPLVFALATGALLALVVTTLVMVSTQVAVMMQALLTGVLYTFALVVTVPWMLIMGAASWQGARLWRSPRGDCRAGPGD